MPLRRAWRSSKLGRITFTGSRANRVEQARVYAGRAESLVEKTRNLLTLEADQAYLRWDESTRKLAKYD